MAKGKHEAPSPRRRERQAAPRSTGGLHASGVTRRETGSASGARPAARREKAARLSPVKDRAPLSAAPRRESGRKRPIALAASLVLIVAIAIGGTLAYLATKTEKVENVFLPTDVQCAVIDNKVKNTGSIAAYIRVAVVQNYVNGSGHVCAAHDQPAALPAPDGWTLRSDGFYYYNSALEPNAETSDFVPASGGTTGDGCVLKTQIIASAIQSVPATAAQEAWRYVPGS